MSLYRLTMHHHRIFEAFIIADSLDAAWDCVNDTDWIPNEEISWSEAGDSHVQIDGEWQEVDE